jgi:hypothetical protein
MAETKKARKSKIENRTCNTFLLYSEKNRLRFETCPTRAPLRVSSFKFLFSTAATLCLLLSAFCLLLFPSCGYHVAGQATRIPSDVKTIAVPAFKNLSSTFRIEQQLTAAVTREFLERTHYRIVANPADADAVLKGTVKEVRARAITFDNNTGLATSLQVQVNAEVKLEDVHSRRLLFSNSNYVYREEYQVSETPAALFQEDKPALDRLSRDLARTLVTDILENF